MKTNGFHSNHWNVVVLRLQPSVNNGKQLQLVQTPTQSRLKPRLVATSKKIVRQCLKSGGKQEQTDHTQKSSDKKFRVFFNYQIHEYKDTPMPGYMDTRIHICLDACILGYKNTWIQYTHMWMHEYMETCIQGYT